LRAESNEFRYVPYYRPVVIRVGDGAEPLQVEHAVVAAKVAGVTVVVARDTEQEFIERVAAIRPAKVRVLGVATDALYARCDELGIPVDDAPVTSIGRLELLHWTREQCVTVTRHRYGNVRR